MKNPCLVGHSDRVSYYFKYTCKVIIQQALFTFLISIASLSFTRAATFTYLGGTGNWHDPAKWDCGGCGEYPGQNRTTDIVEIGSGTVSLTTANITIADLTLNGGAVINGNKTLTINGDFDWSSGRIYISLSLPGSATLNLLTGSTKYLYASSTFGGTTTHSGGSWQISVSVTQSGTYNLTGGSLIITSSLAAFNNTGTMTISATGTPLNGTGKVNNSNTLTINSTIGISSQLENSGTIQGTGSVTMNNNFLWTTGSLNVPLTLSGGRYLTLSGSSAKNLNKLLTITGITNHQGGTLNVNTGGDVTLNGTYNLSNGSLSITSPAIFLNNSGSLNISASGINISGTGTLENRSTLTRTNGSMTLSCLFTNSGTLQGSGSVFINNSMTWTSGNMNIPFIVNSLKTLTLSGTATKNLNNLMTINGTTNQTGGTLSLGSSGDVKIFGTYNLSSGSVSLTAPAVFLNDAGSLNVSTTTGTFSGSGTLNNEATLTRTNGNLTLNCPFSHSGTLQGSGTIFINNSMTWYSGNVNIPVTVNGFKTLTLTNSNTKNLNALLTLNGNTNHQSGNLNIGSGGDVTNNGSFSLASGSITLNGGSVLFLNNSSFSVTTAGSKINGSGTFSNAVSGQFTRSSSSGTLSIECPFENLGTLNHNSGSKLDFNNTFTQSGTLNLNSGSELETSTCTVNNTFSLSSNNTWDVQGILTLNTAFSSTGNLLLSNTVQGSGSLQNNGTAKAIGYATVNVNFTNSSTLFGTGTFDLNAGFTQNGTIAPGNSPGVITLENTSSFQNNGTLDIEILNNNGPGSGHDQISVTGDITLGGTLTVTLLSGFNPSPGDSYVIVQSSSSGISGMFSTENLPDISPNTWNVAPTAGNVTLTVQAPLPVELVYFDAHEAEGDVQLFWETASEKNVSHFEIERRIAGDWLQVSKIVARGDITTPVHYEFSDKNILDGFEPVPPKVIYYRLKVIDLDGTFEYSDVRPVQLSQRTGPDWNIYPNPSSGPVTLSYDGKIEALLSDRPMLNIYTATGQLLHSFPIYQKLMMMDLSSTPSIPAGVYLLQIEANNRVLYRKKTVIRTF